SFVRLGCLTAVGLGLVPLPGESPQWDVGRVLVYMIVPGVMAGAALVVTETIRDDLDTGVATGLVGFGFAVPWMLALLRSPLVDRHVSLTDWAAVPLVRIAVGAFFAARWQTARFRAVGRESARFTGTRNG